MFVLLVRESKDDNNDNNKRAISIIGSYIFRLVSPSAGELIVRKYFTTLCSSLSPIKSGKGKIIGHGKPFYIK